MSSLVSDFLINPVLRQARRLSELSRSATATADVVGPAERPVAVLESEAVEDAIDDLSMISADSPRSRPLSPSTQHTTLDEPMSAPPPPSATSNGISRDHLGFPISPKRTRHLPEDDGMRELRTVIQDINARDVSSVEKARLMHEALLAGYRASKAAVAPSETHESIEAPDHVPEHATPNGALDTLRFWQGQLHEAPPLEKFVLSESDIARTYAPLRQPKSPGIEMPSQISDAPANQTQPLGCQHYERNVKLQCSTCKKWYTCRFCHDAQEDHALIRKETKNMLCMLCATPQRASDVCINCGEITAQYYCDICKLWENRQSKPIYHCNDCGICRRGMGLGKDFFHCKTCRACITTSIESSHKCIERSTDCDCPICGDYMFTSTRPVVFMACGHSIHKKCYYQHMKVSYKCPICNKSLANMETQFRNLDVAIQGQPMPPEFRDTKASILCNDCSGKSTVPYHWLGLKCSICRSYNTVELQILGGAGQALQEAAAERAGADTAIESTESARPVMIQRNSESFNRRRHSSHAPEMQQHLAPDRIARSLSPPGPEASGSQLDDIDSDDDGPSFWGGGDDDSSYYESEEESGEEAEEDDEEDEINLIGHR
ncbi:hypothetical protein B0I35DRAFT_477451 [Stachybotrys elegans]|uniref:RING-type domain-containing protein n=1 Tax=Stachybotrys elegans TaxID=80388 RepID=A0A8K0SVG2_9HYPO|nr:hypothetical protein B0I35DRAFT_477451 [Stachybotrys elegans]